MGLVDILASIFCVVAIPIIGKRKMMLLGLTGVTICCFGVASNAFTYLSFETSSFEIMTPAEDQASVNQYALVWFVCLGLSASVSGCVPWILNSEVYPFR